MAVTPVSSIESETIIPTFPKKNRAVFTRPSRMTQKYSILSGIMRMSKGTGVQKNTAGFPGGMTMTPNQRIWCRARNALARSLTKLGYPEEFADLLAGELGSPKAIERLDSYLNLARPGNPEMIIDEMLAIKSEIEAWREKKESRDAQAAYSAWLRSETRMNMEEEQ